MLQSTVQRAVRSLGYDLVRYREPTPGKVSETGTIITSSEAGREVRFFVLNPNDHIQRRHLSGLFYERDELSLIRAHYSGGTFVDVGANVGNHLLYAALCLDAPKVIAFEPNRHASTILNVNVALNGLCDRVTIHEVGLAENEANANVSEPINNLGAARMQEHVSGGVPIRRGDSLISEPVSFIKMDVEGYEIRALLGLKETIARNKPTLFVEVDNANIPAFKALMDSFGYRIAQTIRRYAENENCLAVPA